MKILKILLMLTTVTVILYSCQSNEEKLSEARENVQTTKEMNSDAKKELNQAIKDSTDDFAKFKLESEKRILLNEQKIVELKTQILKENRRSQEELTKLAMKIEQRNIELKKNLIEFKESGKDKWSIFKTDFNNNLDALGKSIDDFFTVKK